MPRQETTEKNPTAFLGFLLLVYGVAFIGYLGVRRGVPGWYDSLIHPPLTPAPWVFGPVWSLLYILIGVAGWRLWQATHAPGRRAVMALFITQLVLNSVWTWLFFGVQKPVGALIDIAVLWIVLALLILAAFKVKPTAAALLMPYLLWVSFAAYLNYGIWSLNYKNHQGVGRIETIVEPS